MLVTPEMGGSISISMVNKDLQFSNCIVLLIIIYIERYIKHIMGRRRQQNYMYAINTQRSRPIISLHIAITM